MSKVTSLGHESGNDAVEGAALEVQRLARLSNSLFTSAAENPTIDDRKGMKSGNTDMFESDQYMRERKFSAVLGTVSANSCVKDQMKERRKKRNP